MGPKNRILGALGLPGASDFATRDLWGLGEQGLWYNPSDFERYMSAKGPELVANGGFDDTSAWVLNPTAPATATISGGKLTLVSPAGEATFARQDVLTVGKRYAIEGYATVRSGGFRVSLGSGATAAGFVSVTATGAFSGTAVCDGTDGRLFVTRNGACDVDVDWVSVRELTALDTATLFQDAAGTTPVTAMEQPVGLVLDKRLGLVLGDELVVNGACTGTTGWTGNINLTNPNGTSIRADTGAGGVEANATNATPVTAGKWYQVTFDLVAANNSGAVAIGGNRMIIPGPVANSGRKSLIIRATNTQTNGLVFSTNTPTTGYYVEVDNVSVREIPGNHASQATTTARPVLSARKNLLTGTATFAGWSTSTGTLSASAEQSSTGGAYKFAGTATTGRHDFYFSLVGLPDNATVTCSVKLKPAGRNWAIVQLNNKSGTNPYAFVDLTTGSVGTVVGGAIVSTTTDINGFIYITLTASVGAGAGNVTFDIWATTDNGVVSDTADGVVGIYVSSPQVEYGSTATRYQRVNTATDYDWVGFPMYLKFDGVDDFLQTGNIDFTATDKMTVVAGLRKLSDAAIGGVVELSVNSGANNGSFAIFAPNAAGSASYGARMRGTVDAFPTAAGVAAPDTSVIALTGSIGEDSAVLRRNGVVAHALSTDLGTGNYGNYPLYIGRRAGTSLPFNGHLYQLGIRGALTGDTKLKAWERNVAPKTGVTL